VGEGSWDGVESVVNTEITGTDKWEQVLGEEMVKDLDRVCDACRDHKAWCKWPAHDHEKTCERCSERWIRCMIEKVAVSKCPLRCVGRSPLKKRQVDTPEELDSGVEVVRTWKAPVGGLEKALWSVVCAIEGLASGQAMIQKELVELQKSSHHLEEHFELIADNVKSMADSVEMLTCGDWYLQVREKGKLEVPEGPEYALWKTRQRLDSLEQRGKEPERELEVEPEMEPEVVPVDVEMTLQ